jgi:hypothetical protein
VLSGPQADRMPSIEASRVLRVIGSFRFGLNEARSSACPEDIHSTEMAEGA